MKFSLSLLVLFALSFPAGVLGQSDSINPEEPLIPRIEDCRTGMDLELGQFLENCERADVILLGEQHDNDSGHEFQLNVIQKLTETGRPIAISMEQFERDVQGVLDDYLAGRIDEEQFLNSSRPWKNYEPHYRPIIEFAKANQIPVLAANIPGRIAKDVADGKPVALADKPFVPRETTALQNQYWENFRLVMKDHVGTGGDNALQRFYASQCLKDDAMAEAITDYLATNGHQKKTVVHLCGNFHSDYGLGVGAKVLQREPLANCTIVTMELQPIAKEADLAKVHSRAHYVFWTVKNPDQSVDAKQEVTEK